MNKIAKTILLFSISILGFIAGLVVFIPLLREKPQISFEATYEEVSLDQMNTGAELIFAGKVVSISPAKWNQNSGQYWQEEGKLTLPYHEIEVATNQVLFDSIGADKNVIITVLGGSPSGSVDGAVQISDNVAHNLKVGDEAVFFVVKRNLAWQNGTYPILRFMGNPMMGYLLKGNDGLYRLEGAQNNPGISINQLVEQIAKR